jgi:hypothetical protein
MTLKDGSVGKHIHIALRQVALLPTRKLALQRMEDPREGRWTGRRASELLDDGADSLLADATDEHVAHQRIDLSHAALVAVEELRVKGAARAGHRQIVNHPDRGAECAGAMAGALIAPLACPFISVGTDELRDLFFQDGATEEAYGSMVDLARGKPGGQGRPHRHPPTSHHRGGVRATIVGAADRGRPHRCARRCDKLSVAKVEMDMPLTRRPRIGGCCNPGLRFTR